MVKIHVQEDCGNAPKKMFVRDFIIAAVNADQSFLDKNSTEDMQWSVIGGPHVEGKKSVLAALMQSRGGTVAELIIRTIVTHGYDGVAEGQLKLKDGQKIAFCDVFRFRASTNNAPVKAITTYAIALATK